jgi:hypothetical protein
MLTQAVDGLKTSARLMPTALMSAATPKEVCLLVQAVPVPTACSGTTCVVPSSFTFTTRQRTVWPSGQVDADVVARSPTRRLDLRGVDPATAEVATTLASSYRLRAADAVHLATAIVFGADRFITDNRRDFPVSISEIDVTYPDGLDEP